jgi:hypothetical protein
MRKTKKGKEDELAPQRTQDSQRRDPHCRRVGTCLWSVKVPHAPRLALLQPVQSKRGGWGVVDKFARGETLKRHLLFPKSTPKCKDAVLRAQALGLETHRLAGSAPRWP